MTKLTLDRTPFYRFHWFSDSWSGPERDEALNALRDEEASIDNYRVEVWFDSDSNRAFDVLYLRGEPLPLFEKEEDRSAFEEACRDDETEAHTICSFLCDVVDELPPNTHALILGHRGKVLWTSTDQEGDFCDVQEPYKPSIHQYQLARPFPTLLRSQLTLTGRLGRFVDKVTYRTSQWGDEKTAVFKYSHPTPWCEIQTLAQLPAHHPHMISMECIVLEELTGLGVIGFTTRFIDTPTMDRWPPSRPFKLRWLQELMGVLDELHLQYGIHHLDLTDRNLVIDPDTDKLVVIDFGLSGTHKPGGFRYDWDDLKAMVAFLYHRITLDSKYKDRLPDAAEEASLLLAWDRWVKHPDVVLDHDAVIFYDELVAWLKKRRQTPPAAPQPPPPPHQITTRRWPPSHLKDEVFDERTGLMMDLCAPGSGSRKRRQKFGRPALTWHRPPQSKVDPVRRLLATGRYADEEEAVSGRHVAIAVPDPKLGFPQPPVSAFNAAAAATASASGSRKRKRIFNDSPLVSGEVGEAFGGNTAV
ncbi:hypothetical protein B0T25DRAFT_221896 [Lasiosphaeria hispida]|uniref:Protein kinase domain-containing protein n=1 Tax=Lasiosphaeria hispida TaxID=260671 RepID=A0AAJ0HJH0_9PEZI|nr:hypothetical protein B0T25DRAFT_221896 [Lasiosphaeria hispida]